MTGLSEAELNAMIEEATVDCNDEEEALTGFATLVEENLEVPFETTILGVTVTVTGVTHSVSRPGGRLCPRPASAGDPRP